MTQIKEVLEKERNRLERGDLGNIYLFQEGSFYRAYEWSAWLCCRYINPFKVTRREYSAELTNDGTMAFVGFPVTSLGKYVPDAWQVNYMGEKNLSVSLPLEVFNPIKAGASVIDDFANWKMSVPLAVAKKRSFKEDLKYGIPKDGCFFRVSDVLSEIMAFPIEQKSPMECMTFLASLKQQIASMI